MINIPKHFQKEELTNDYIIRRTAVDFGVPLITNRQLAERLTEALERYRRRAAQGAALAGVRRLSFPTPAPRFEKLPSTTLLAFRSDSKLRPFQRYTRFPGRVLMEPAIDRVDRRRFMTLFAGLGVTGTALPALLWDQVNSRDRLTGDDVAAAAKLAGLELTADERDLMMTGLEQLREDYQALREVVLDNSVPPALLFDPTIGGEPSRRQLRLRPRENPGAPPLPDDPAEIAFLPAAELGRLLRTRLISSVALTELYLERLGRLGGRLECVISLTGERALEQAERADSELDRGPCPGPPPRRSVGGQGPAGGARLSHHLGGGPVPGAGD